MYLKLNFLFSIAIVFSMNAGEFTLSNKSTDAIDYQFVIDGHVDTLSISPGHIRRMAFKGGQIKANNGRVYQFDYESAGIISLKCQSATGHYSHDSIKAHLLTKRVIEVYDQKIEFGYIAHDNPLR